MKKNTLENRPAAEICEIERLNSYCEKIEFDLELANRKRILLENSNKDRIRNLDAIIEKKLSSIQAAKKASIERSKMVLVQERAFVALSASDQRCLPFKDPLQVKAVYGSKACQMEACICAKDCKSVCSALPNIKRFTTGTGEKTFARKATVAFRYVVKGNYPNVTVNVIDSPIGEKVYSVNESNRLGFRKILLNDFRQYEVTGNQISGLTKILNQKGFTLR